MWVGPLGQEDPLEEGMATPVFCIQYSCLENPKDRGAWWATIHGVAESDMTKAMQRTHTMGTALNHEGPKGFSHSGMAENQELLWRLGSSVNLQGNF